MTIPLISFGPQRAQHEQYNNNPIDKLARAIVDIALLPIRIFATIIMLPLLIPIMVMHSIAVITINSFLMFSFFSISMMFLLTASEIIFPIGLLGVLLISALSINAIDRQIQNNFQNLFREFSIL